MRRHIIFFLAAVSAVFSACINDPAEDAVPELEISVRDISSTGCVVDITLHETAVSYLMDVFPKSVLSSYDPSTSLLNKYPSTAESRIVERLHGEKTYVIAAMAIAEDGKEGEVVYEEFTLTDFNLEVNLYSPGEDEAAELNKYNTLKVEAYSNGLAASGRCALAVGSIWKGLVLSMGIEAAAEEVFSSRCSSFTLQQLEEIADRTQYKRDILYFGDLDAGTEYTFVICLVDLDGVSHYYSFDGSTKPKPAQ